MILQFSGKKICSEIEKRVNPSMLTDSFLALF